MNFASTENLWQVRVWVLILMAETSWCHINFSKWPFRELRRVLQSCLIFLSNPEVTLANLADVTIIMLATPHTAQVQQSLRVVFHAMKHHLYNTVKLTCLVKNLISVTIMTGFLWCRSTYCPIWFHITKEGWRVGAEANLNNTHTRSKSKLMLK